MIKGTIFYTNRDRKITLQELKETLVYDPNAGDFRWAPGVCRPRAIPGEIAGSKGVQGYWMIGVNGKLYGAHRLAWLYMTGRFPERWVDHINGIKDDNRFCNLREATPGQNKANAGGWGKSGLKGAHKCSYSSRWHSTICGKYLGSFKTKEEAHLAYCAAAKEKHGEYWSK